MNETSTLTIDKLFNIELLVDFETRHTFSSPWFSLAKDGTVLQYPIIDHKYIHSDWGFISTDNNMNQIKKHPPPFCQLHKNVQSFIQVWAERNNFSCIDWSEINLNYEHELDGVDVDVLNTYTKTFDVKVYCMIIAPTHSSESKGCIFDGRIAISGREWSEMIEQIANIVMTIPNVVFA